MIIRIALGVMLGVLFLIIAFIITAVIGAGIVHMQDRIEEPPKKVGVRIRPEADSYKRMQEIKRKAKENHPEHWKEEER